MTTVQRHLAGDLLTADGSLRFVIRGSPITPATEPSLLAMQEHDVTILQAVPHGCKSNATLGMPGVHGPPDRFSLHSGANGFNNTCVGVTDSS